MGTSNWQNVSYCIDLLRAVQPRTVLDVGHGFGRWGIVCREFLDVWEGRVRPDDWTTRIVGVDAFGENLQPYHRAFYTELHSVTIEEYLLSHTGEFDLAILGDVLEHLDPPNARLVAERLKQRCSYILLNIPLGSDWAQAELYGNKFEVHRSVWDVASVSDLLPPLRYRVFQDYIGRPFGTFLWAAGQRAVQQFELSRNRGLAMRIFEQEAAEGRRLALQEPVPSELKASIEKLSIEIASRQRPPVKVTSVGKSPQAKGAEVWILAYGSDELPHFHLGVQLNAQNCRVLPHGLARTNAAMVLVDAGSSVELPALDGDLYFEFLSHPYSGVVEISMPDGAVSRLDLFGSDHQRRSLKVRHP
jgi:hypothetical protein